MTGCIPLRQAEIEAIQGSLSKLRDRTLFTLGIKSGFRISEILSLKVADVFQYGRAVEEVALERKNTKGKIRGRSIPLHDDARTLIEELIQKTYLEPGHYLFQSQKGRNKPISRSQAWRLLKQVFAENKIQGKVATHTLRKTFAARFYEASGRDLLATQAALGHVNINSTVSYLSVHESKIRDTIKKM